MALRPEIRELVLLFAQQAAREFLAEEATALAEAETKKPRDLSGDGAKVFRNAESNPIP